MKVAAALKNQLEKNFSSLENKEKLLENPNEKDIRRYDPQKTVVGQNVGKLLNSVTSRLDGMPMSIRRAGSWCHWTGISELDYSSEQLG